MNSAKFPLYPKCLEGSNIPQPHFLCANLVIPGSMFCLKEMPCPSKAKINPHCRHRQCHLKRVASLGNKLNSTWTPRNVGYVNNKMGKS